jgi:hypothetical protein
MPTIEFKPLSELYSKVYESPRPAAEQIPEWYKKQQSYDGGVKVMSDSGLFNYTVKRCAPVYDTLTAGYIYNTPLDVYFEKVGGVHRAVWGTAESFGVTLHQPGQISNFPFDRSRYEAYPIKFSSGWITITPPGYSILMTNPMWRDEKSPYVTMPGIIDSDTYRGATNFFILIEKDFEGVIPKGTPIAQIIPFRREEWDCKIGEYEKDYFETESLKDRALLSNSYKKLHRKEKIWNRWKKDSDEEKQI